MLLEDSSLMLHSCEMGMAEEQAQICGGVCGVCRNTLQFLVSSHPLLVLSSRDDQTSQYRTVHCAMSQLEHLIALVAGRIAVVSSAWDRAGRIHSQSASS
ncbi:hypothetical protein AcW2_000487 [Taiwanofungus camphoratus]|nr:hypothetical protein AcW2_000487 [Antrodia cinnamomea]